MSTTPRQDVVEIDDRAGEIRATAILVRASAELNGPPIDVDALAASVDAWGGVPVTIRHPTSASGEHVPIADDPDPAIVGEIARPEWIDDDAVRAELVLDVDALAAHGDLGAETLDTLAAAADRPAGRVAEAEQVHVSVGYHYETSPDPQHGEIVSEIGPDHVAIVETGACSPAEGGCGVPRVQRARADLALDDVDPEDVATIERAIRAEVRAFVDEVTHD